MKSRLYWGLGIFLILVVGATVFKVIQDQSEIRQLQKDLVETQKQLKDSNDPTPVSHTSIDFTKPPLGKTFEGGGHWHNGEWHDAPHATPEHISDTTNPTELTEAELKRLLEEEAKWEALFAAEKEENAKKHARKLAEYKLAKKGHDIALKLAAVNSKQSEIINAQESGDDPSSEVLEQTYKESRDVRKLMDQYMKEVEEFNNETD